MALARLLVSPNESSASCNTDVVGNFP
ncbi:5e837cd2-de72-4c9c-b00d-2e870d187b9b [Thermothielavioides terrestris]|uniref:5e837cd2-de72-4c9c-b00d-2e870d187b9b n=1 Tax=Thermothielavioides terrestris TaxID=2587410 RepID=A0A446BWY4_9PEZI|nr:5e837cd2-de72-4c9c-b00d-2e870d187b9b [Thermothielavioides terrestris]